MNENLKLTIKILNEIAKTDSRALEALEALDTYRYEQIDIIRRRGYDQSIKESLEHTERLVVALAPKKGFWA